MNQTLLIYKWRLLLIQGILLIILSISYFYSGSINLEIVSNFTGSIALLTGCISISDFFIESLEEKNISELILGFFICGLGMIIICSLFFAKELIIFILIALILLNALQLVGNFIKLRTEVHWWWISILFFIYTIFISVFIKIEILKEVLWILIGFQFFINGLFQIIIALFLRKLQLDFTKTIEEFKK